MLDPKSTRVVRATAGDRNTLREGEVHVWTAELCASRERVDDFVLSLSPGETLRASKYVFERDRENFILCRGMLRALLGAYLAVPGPAVEISTDLRGKPELARHLRGSDLRFNLSHSHGLAIFAFTRGPNGNFAFNFFIALNAQPDLKFNFDRQTYRQSR